MTLRSALIAGIPLCLFATFMLMRPVGAQDSAASSGQFDAAALKKAVEDIGYETKALNAEAGKEKYEFNLTRDGLKIPIATEISGSRSYIWFTVFLGEAPGESSAPASKFAALLKSNAEIQPAQFYITKKGGLMMGITIENRAMTNALVRRTVEMIASHVVKTKDVWGK